MKHCPTCNRSFDDTKAFCGLDGTRLVEDAPTGYAGQQQQQPYAGQQHDQPAAQGWPSGPVIQPTPPAPQRVEAPRVAQAPAADPLERIRCEWCQAMNEKSALSCR